MTTAADIRELRDNEINQRLQESYEELWNLRFKHATNQLTNNRDIRRVRKEIARLKTVQREREIWAEYEAQQEQ
ncbi:MAG TPA: 50S ribosomal protein L29 [Ardenticatenaceae bacterium]